MKALRKLNAMVGKGFIYKQKNIVIKDVDLTDDGVTIETSTGDIKIKAAAVGKFIEDCLPVASDALVVMSKQEQNHMAQLKDILLDNIKRCQNDPAYVKQATVINNNVNTLINMVSLELKVRKSGM